MQLNTFHLLSCLLLLYASCQRFASSRPAHSADGTELIVVEEILHCTPVWCRNTTTDAPDHTDNESVLDVVDDLIFLAKKPKQKQNQQQYQTQTQHVSPPRPPQSAEASHQIDLLTIDEEDTLVAASGATAADSTSAEHGTGGDGDRDGDGDGEGAADGDGDGNADGVPSEIELRADGAGADADAAAPITPIDMSDFVTLIPAEEVKSIAANYYHNDAEVQRAYAYLSSADFALLKRRIIEVPETAAFLRYLNNSGLDVLGFLHALTNLTANNAATVNATASLDGDGQNAVTPTNGIPNIERHATDAVPPTTITTTDTMQLAFEEGIITTISPTTIARTTTTTTTGAIASLGTTTLAKDQQQQQLNGLHGLVDAILDVLPQDRILSTFFDKLENNEQFTKLVDNISSPRFARILSNMEKSVPLRNLIFNLHNNGIYVTRIVDSLKSYFFLGGF